MKIENGEVVHPRVKRGRLVYDKNGNLASIPSTIVSPPGRKRMPVIRGIVVHQTDTKTTEGVFGGITSQKSFHFLIDKDGRIYQTFSLEYKANHIGLIHSRCIMKNTCTPDELKQYGDLYPKHYVKGHPEKIHKIESEKENRYPMNEDSIGIECIGRAYVYEKDRVTRSSNQSRDGVPENRLLYEPLTPEQLESLEWLIRLLAGHFGVLMTEVYRHPEIARKNPTEAISAKELIESLQKEETEKVAKKVESKQ